ncbi:MULTISPECIES: helix-turn-helix domain-containing protein [Rossellomorea]|uniref:helix-turn-helix domain-containing protein n=1 Tax=Rossellomorea TaxID=2837508 RepID=UPI0011E8AA76|nr:MULTISPECIES: helix-turn-helix domain-containing protein [Rossellomorea]MDT9027375.1 helix-turn-helix domain-containing protein [Rossellomorea sp. YC4-1]TYS91460.1 helix-turn-helix domain-containing protein [Rossellomorea aquimaris]
MNKRTWLIKLRKRKKMTQQEVASKAFIERSYYAQIENGIRKPSSEVTVKLGEVLDFHASSFNLEENPFSIALKNAPVVLAHCDTQLRYTWIFNTPDLIPDDHIGKTDVELNDNEGNRSLMRLKQEVLDKKSPFSRVISIPLTTGTVSYQVYAHPLLNEEGTIIGVATASTEINTYNPQDGINKHK